MYRLQKFRKLSIVKWVSSNFIDGRNVTSSHMASSFCIANNYRVYSGIVNSDNLGKTLSRKISCAARKGAQAALLEYLHLTRNIPFLDAENMSLNSPNFLRKLIQQVDFETDIATSVPRFFRYHPINEFEPFFESLGLKPCEYIPLLPHDLMFLCDDDILLENYHVLCFYGIPRNKIGRIYKDATEIFRYDYGVLPLKLQAYEQLGLTRSFICKVVACSPYLLIGDVNVEFMKVLEILRKGEMELSWIEGHLLDNSYNWSQMLSILNLFRNSGYSEQELLDLISQYPMIVFESSGDRTLSLIVFLFKFGSSMNQICSMFLQFSSMRVGEFVSNLRKCFRFLTEIQMEENQIGRIVRSHPQMLGSCALKKTLTIRVNLNAGKKRICKIIQENPEEMKKWVLGSRIERLPKTAEKLFSKMLKTEFLLKMGLVENPKEIENTLKCYPGSGREIQERFDCIVKAGLDRKDVCKMIRKNPLILSMQKEVLEKKIGFLVNELGYSTEDLVCYPASLCYSGKRVKLRLEMYNWLKMQGTVNSLLSFTTVIACTEKYFVRRYVQHHPQGLQVWHQLKENFHS